MKRSTNTDAIIPNIRPPVVRAFGSQKYLKSNIAKVYKIGMKKLPKIMITYIDCWLYIVGWAYKFKQTKSPVDNSTIG